MIKKDQSQVEWEESTNQNRVSDAQKSAAQRLNEAKTVGTTTNTQYQGKAAETQKYDTDDGGGSYGSGSGVSKAATEPLLDKVDPSKSVDYSSRDNASAYYQQAMDNLSAASQNAPGYDNQYQGAIDAAYSAIINRKGFQYDLNDDQMYQQYRDKYLQQAQLSMKDSMGQAAALNGGYGSSYGQMVGQQAYDAQLQNLNDVVPTLYQQAYSRYQDEGDQLQQNLDNLRNLEATDYSRYQDNLSQWNTDRSYAQSEADRAWDQFVTERSYADDRESALTTEQQNNASKLMTLASYGYKPTAQEIADAGITPEQWEAYKSAISGSSVSIKDEAQNSGITYSKDTAAVQKALRDMGYGDDLLGSGWTGYEGSRTRAAVAEVSKDPAKKEELYKRAKAYGLSV